MKQQFLRSLFRSSIIALLLVPAGFSAGSVNYAYEGKPFTTVSGNVPLGKFLSINLTFSAPLPANLSDEVITPLAWSISDGVAADTLTNTNNTYATQGFEFETDSSGNILRWAIGVIGTTNSAFSIVGNRWALWGLMGTVDKYYEDTNVSINDGQPGTWSSAPVSIAPEPASFLLVSLPAALVILTLATKRSEASRR